MRSVPTIDATGLEGLETVIRRGQAQKIRVVLSGVHPQILQIMDRLGTTKLVGAENISRTFQQQSAKRLFTCPTLIKNKNRQANRRMRCKPLHKQNHQANA